MKTIPLLLAAAAMAASLTAIAGPSAGDPAPAFRLQDQNGEWHSLGDYGGRWVALYFYPKDDTPGCTTEACAFRDDIFQFKQLGVQIIGVSVDDVASHEAFARKYQLPFPLLADSSRETAGAYGVLRNFGLFKIASRQTFIIDPDGRIAKHYAQVDPDQHSAQVLADLRTLIDPQDG